MQPQSNNVDLFTIQIKKYMNDDFIIVDHKETLSNSIATLQSEKKSSILVIKDNLLFGIITEQDIVRKITLKDNHNNSLMTAMTQPVISVHEDDLLFYAVGKMRKNKFRHIPVINKELYPVGMIDLQSALAAELGTIINEIDQLSYDDDSTKSLIKIKKQQISLTETLINQNASPGDISYLLSFLNNVIYRSAIKNAEKTIKEKKLIETIPAYCVITMGSGGRMESFLHPDQDNGIIYDDHGEDPKQVDLYFLELAKEFTKTLDECDIPYCKGDLMASNLLWRKSISDWKKQINEWTSDMTEQHSRYIDMLYDFRSVYGKEELADELRKYIIEKLQGNHVLKFLYKSEEMTNSGINFFGGFILEKEDEENLGLLNLKHTGTLPLVESIRLYSIKHGITNVSTLGRLKGLKDKGVFTEDEHNFFKSAFRFLSDILLKNQVERAKQGKVIKNFIDPKKLLDLDKQLLKIYLKKIKNLKERARGDFGEEYF
jgi:CBS domain-containing protein